jgi:excisionase family DNA binding protein
MALGVVNDIGPPRLLYSFTEAAYALDVSVRQVHIYVKRGDLESVHLGPKLHRISRQALEDFCARLSK